MGKIELPSQLRSPTRSRNLKLSASVRCLYLAKAPKRNHSGGLGYWRHTDVDDVNTWPLSVRCSTGPLTD